MIKQINISLELFLYSIKILFNKNGLRQSLGQGGIEIWGLYYYLELIKL